MECQPSLKINGQVHIVGESGFQNELLSEYIKKRIDCVCTYAEIYQPVLISEDTKAISLILQDCQSIKVDHLSAAVEAIVEAHPSNSYFALFNVDSNISTDCRYEIITKNVRGIFFKHDKPKTLIKGIKTIMAGHLWFSRETMEYSLIKNKESGGPYKQHECNLTRRENEILQMIATGFSNGEIADKCCISPHTVKTHIYNIYKKIDVPNRLQAALWANRYLHPDGWVVNE